MSLSEREHVFNQLNDLLEDFSNGSNVIGVIGGSAGMGKTTVLRDFSGQASERGITVLSATSSPADENLPYATLGRLLPEGVEIPLPLTSPGVDPERVWLQVAQQANWAIAELSRDGAVLIVIDDAQSTDVQTLRCLQYLYVAHERAAGRLGLVFAQRPQPGRVPAPILRDLFYRPEVHHIWLEPLSLNEVAQLVGDRSGQPGAETADSYHALSGGNPLLLKAMIGEYSSIGMAVTAKTTAKFQQAVQACVYRLGPVAVRFAHAIALLGSEADVHRLSLLQGLSVEEASEVIKAMAEAGLLEGVRFRHDAMRHAVLRGVPTYEAAEFHYRAAQLLYSQEVPASSIAPHLLGATPLIDQEWAFSILQVAAHEAFSENKVAVALQYLMVAGECCQESQKASIKVRTAVAQQLLEPSSEAWRFTSLKALVLSGKVEGHEALQVAEGLLWHLQIDDAVEIIDYVSESTENAALESGVQLRTLRAYVDASYPGFGSRFKAVAAASLMANRGDSVVHSPQVRAAQSLAAVLTRVADGHTVARAEQVLQGERLGHGSLRTIESALLSLIYSDALESAAIWCDRFATEADGYGVPAWQALFDTYAAMISLRRGHLDVAAERSERALTYMTGESWNRITPLAIATLAEAHIAICQHDVAAEQFARPVPPQVFDTRAGLHYLYARGRHHLALERPHAALADFNACGELMIRWNVDCPSLVPWRIGAADAWLRLGERRRATVLVNEQLAQTATGFRRARGVALRCLASVQSANKRPATLEKALQSLQLSDDRYESARTLADLSQACWMLGDKAKARAAARRARRIARSCHSDELGKTLLSTSFNAVKLQAVDNGFVGHDSFANLSNSERRVAVLAARGHSNRDVAAQLFITVSTVEQHLTRIYSKMGIRNREELPAEFGLDSSISR